MLGERGRKVGATVYLETRKKGFFSHTKGGLVSSSEGWSEKLD